MADLKISQLSNATTPLAGTEVLPIVQGGSTKKATIDQILSPASGKGINFSAAGGDTLTIYDEGAWTPAQGPEVTVVGDYSSSATYTRIGRQVTVKIKLAGSTSIACTPFGRLLTDLPFTSAAGDAVGTLWVEGVPESRIALVSGNSTTMYATAAFGAPATAVIITATYFV